MNAAAGAVEKFAVCVAVALERMYEFQLKRPNLHERLANLDGLFFTLISKVGIGPVGPLDEAERPNAEHRAQQVGGAFQIVDHNADLHGPLELNAHRARYPPSTSSVIPVIIAEASDAKKMTGPTIS